MSLSKLIVYANVSNMSLSKLIVYFNVCNMFLSNLIVCKRFKHVLVKVDSVC